MLRCIEILEELCASPEGIQAAWQKRIPPERRHAAGFALRKYIKTNFLILKGEDSSFYFNPLMVSTKIDLKGATDLYSFFVTPKLDDDFYFEE